MMQLFLVFLAISGAFALYENCDYSQNLELDDQLYVSSPGYPYRYRPGQSCRWYANSPPGTRIFLICQKFDITASPGCSIDRVSISLTGSIDLSDAHKYCGRGSFSVMSVTNKMNIVLEASRTSYGGSFLCDIGVEKVDGPVEPTPSPGSCECGWKNGFRIVGGHNTGVNEYPMMAGVVDGVLRKVFCGATIISPNFALTAAHCVVGQDLYKKGLLVGDHEISSGTDTNSSALYEIDRFIVHPEYNAADQINDIALIHVKRPIEFSLQVGPACLPFTNSRQNFDGKTVQALGWGTTDFGGTNSDILQKVDLNVINTKKCQEAYGSTVSDKQICTYTPGKDTCQNDSGGPLLWQEEGIIKILGIVSYGFGCDMGKPSVNTKVSEYLKWITDNASEDYCVK